MSATVEHQPGKIIFLHGASSSGKSSLARALQAKIEEPFLHLSIDHLRDSGALPLDRIKSGEFPWAHMRAAFFDGFHRALASFAVSGNNLIVEHILDTDDWLPDLVSLFSPFEVYFIGVHCSLAELTRREAERKDRQIGSATKDFNSVHQGLRYDLEIDSEAPLEQNVEKILQAWRSRHSPTVFAQMATARRAR